MSIGLLSACPLPRLFPGKATPRDLSEGEGAQSAEQGRAEPRDG